MAATIHASTPAGAETAFHPQLFRGSANKGAGAPLPPPPAAVTCSLSTSSTTSAAVTRTASPSVSPSPSSTSDYSHLPIHGLQIDASQYPLHPCFSSSSNTSSTPQIRLITANQYAELVYNHSNIKLNEERILFPWLHGADIPNSAQAENFGFRNGAYKAVPR